MARRSNSTPPGEVEVEGAVPVETPSADVAETPPVAAEAPALGLLEAIPDANPRPSELASALGSAPGEGAPASSSGPTPSGAPEASGYRRPDFKKWSANRAKKATRKELVDRLRELEAVAESTPPAIPGKTPGESGEPEMTRETLLAVTMASLAATFRIVGGIGGRLRGPHWKLEETEVEALAGAWAPVLAPHLGELAEYMPLLGAVAVTAEVVLPRVERDIELAKLNGAEELPSKVASAAE